MAPPCDSMVLRFPLLTLQGGLKASTSSVLEKSIAPPPPPKRHCKTYLTQRSLSFLIFEMDVVKAHHTGKLEG